MRGFEVVGCSAVRLLLLLLLLAPANNCQALDSSLQKGLEVAYIAFPT